MRDLDQLVTAMREQTDALPPTPLLSHVRRRTQAMRARRRAAGLSAVALLVVTIVGGVAFVGRQGSTSPSNASRVDINPAHLLGTWFLESWTTTAGHQVQPNTGRVPTLRFDNKTSASSNDTVNETSWTMRLDPGTLVGVAGSSTAVAESFGSEPVYEAVRNTLNGHATWQITGSQLVIRGPNGSLAYSNDPAARALGGVDIYLLARAYNPYYVGGTVAITPVSGGPAITARVDSSRGLQVSHLAAGSYHVQGTVSGGTCAPTEVTVIGDTNASLQIKCLLDR